MRLDQLPPWLRYAVVITALALIVYEAIGYQGEPRYWLLVLYSAMIGLPALFGLNRGGPNDPPPGPPVPPDRPGPNPPREVEP